MRCLKANYQSKWHSYKNAFYCSIWYLVQICLHKCIAAVLRGLFYIKMNGGGEGGREALVLLFLSLSRPSHFYLSHSVIEWGLCCYCRNIKHGCYNGEKILWGYVSMLGNLPFIVLVLCLLFWDIYRCIWNKKEQQFGFMWLRAESSFHPRQDVDLRS